MSGTATVTGLYRYPVKGLSPEPLPEAALEKGETLAWDRAFAIENGSADFDPPTRSISPRSNS